MIRPRFLTQPLCWTRTPREMTDRRRYGCAIEVGRRSIWDRLRRFFRML